MFCESSKIQPYKIEDGSVAVEPTKNVTEVKGAETWGGTSRTVFWLMFFFHIIIILSYYFFKPFYKVFSWKGFLNFILCFLILNLYPIIALILNNFEKGEGRLRSRTFSRKRPKFNVIGFYRYVAVIGTFIFLKLFMKFTNYKILIFPPFFFIGAFVYLCFFINGERYIEEEED